MKKFTTLMAITVIALMPIGISFGYTASNQISTATFFSNNLPADGCQQIVRIKGIEYSLANTSYIAVANAFAKRSNTDNSSVRQKIVYTPTGAVNTVLCGRGSNKVLSEVNVSSFLPTYSYIYANLLPDMSQSNGCEHTVTIGIKRYALDASSYNIVEDEFSYVINPDRTIHRRINYRITGQNKTVSCGLGTSMTLPEMSINNIYFPMGG